MATAASSVTKQDKLAKDVQAIISPYLKEKSTVPQVPEIQDNDNYTNYAQLAKTVKGKMSEVDEAYDDLIKRAHEQHKATIAKKKKYWQPLSDLFTTIQRRMNQYTQKKEQERLREEQRLRDQAKEQEQNRLIAEAAQLEQEGKIVEASQVMEEAEHVEAPAIATQSAVPIIAGVHTRNNPWTFEIIDQTKIADEYWTPDIDAIKAIVKAKGPTAETIIGKDSVRIFRENTTVIKG